MGRAILAVAVDVLTMDGLVNTIVDERFDPVATTPSPPLTLVGMTIAGIVALLFGL